MQTVILDTGSSDLYFDASTASTCSLPSSNENSCQGGTFDLSKSSTYKQALPAPAFNTSFGDGSTANGPYGLDVIGIGNVEVSPVQFGVANQVTSTTGFAIGLMGVGYSTNEAVTSVRNFYQNVPEVLAAAGVIASRLYSVFLNDADAISGTILFGGVDRAKYTGTMATLDLIPAAYGSQIIPTINQFITTITAASVTSSGRTQQLWSGGSPDVNAYSRSDKSLPVLLDTGSTAFTLPSSYYNSYIAKAFPYVDRQGLTSCKNANSGDSLSLTFGNKVTVKVDASEFIVPLVNSTTKQTYPYGDGYDTCLFLIQPADTSDMAFYIAGQAVLRSMYVVYDLDNGQVSIAQAAANATNSDVVAVKAGANGVASAVSGLSTAAPNTWSIAAQVQRQTNSYVVSTASPPIGTATGANAIPAGARTTGGSSNAGSGGSAASSSKGSAAGVVIPGADYTAFWVTSLWVAGIALGAGIMM